MAASQQDLHDALGGLAQELDDAYWAASTIEGKDMIRGAASAVSDCLVQLDVDDIKTRTAEYLKLKEDLNSATEKLGQIKDAIDGIVHKVDTAKSVVNGIGKAVEIISSFLK